MQSIDECSVAEQIEQTLSPLREHHRFAASAFLVIFLADLADLRVQLLWIVACLPQSPTLLQVRDLRKAKRRRVWQSLADSLTLYAIYPGSGVRIPPHLPFAFW